MVLASVETKETLERWEFNVEYEFKPPSWSMTISDSLGTYDSKCRKSTPLFTL